MRYECSEGRSHRPDDTVPMGQTAKAPRYAGLKPASVAASRVKSRNRAGGTKAEHELRRALWALGYRYRTHTVSLPGKPDLVFTKKRIAVFVDGDFWHGRDWPERRRRLSEGANSVYWVEKIRYNMDRDQRVTEELMAARWSVLRLWETDIQRDLPRCVSLVVALLTST